jgi:hypothetical protein
MPEQKPTFKSPPAPPFKPSAQAAAPAKPSDPTPENSVTLPPIGPDEWLPISTAPDDKDAKFRIRVTTKDPKTGEPRPVGGTETLVRYRPTRKRVGGKWKSALAMIDDRLGTKLGFKPTEWSPAPEEKTP